MKKRSGRKASGERFSFKTLGRLWAYFRRYWPLVLLAALAGVLGSAMEVAGSDLIRRTVDSLQAGAFSGALNVVLPAAAILLARALSSFSLRYASGKAATHTIRDIKNDAVRHISRLTAQSLSKSRTGDYLSRLTTDIDLIIRFVQDDLTIALADPFLLVFYLIYLLYLNPLLFVISIIPTAVFLPLGSRLITRFKAGSKEYMAFNAQVVDTVVDMTGGMQVVKSYNLEDTFYKQYGDNAVKARDKAIANDRAQYKGYLCFNLSGSLSFMLCLMLGGLFCLQGSLTLGGLIAFLTLLPGFMNIINDASYRLFNINASFAAAERVFAIMDEPMEQSGPVTQGMEEAPAIEFDGVHFAYDESVPVLRDVSFSVNEGETVAVIGSSGGGKTTALNLVCAFYRPQSGSVRIKGVDIAGWDVMSLRQNLSYVSQSAYLFPVSVRENIAFGKVGATMDEIKAAAISAGADGFITALPEGYETNVGERGTRLSGGQVQRIAIARAFLKDAPILLLDEATSALDVESEAGIKEAIKKLSEGRTVMIVAHRLSTIINADRILVLHEGVIAESGTHFQLMESGKIYPQLYAVCAGKEGGGDDR